MEKTNEGEIVPGRFNLIATCRSNP